MKKKKVKVKKQKNVGYPQKLIREELFNSQGSDTKFKKGVIVNSLRNRLIKFPNEKEHTGSTNNCEEPYRLVLNINYTL